MNREVLDRWCERGIIGLVLAILVFGPLAAGAVRTLELLVIQGLTMVVMALWGLRFWLNPRPQLLWPPICWAVIAFAVYAVIRYLTADIEYVARQELIRILIYTFLFFAILNNLHRQESTQVISLTMIFLAMAISLYAIYQFLTGSSKVPSLGAIIESLIFPHKTWFFTSPYQHRGAGTYINPNHLGGFLELLAPLGLAYTLTSRLKPVAKVFLGYAALAILAGIGATLSRGSWISTLLALLLFFGALLFHRTYRLPSMVLLVALVGAGVFFVSKTYFVQARLRQLYSEGKVDDDLRFKLWEPAFRLWQDNPWWGAGPGHFDYRFRAYRPAEVQLQPDRAHNDFLNTLADWGVVGAAMVAAAWALLCLGVLKTWRFVRGTASALGKQQSNKFAFVLGASIGLAALFFHSAVDFNMHIPANAILVIALMALLSSLLRFATERYWASLGAGAKVLASAVVLAGLAFLGQQAWRHAVEYAWLERAAGAPNFSPAQAAWLEKAFVAEPQNPETAYAIGEAFRVQSWEGGENYPELANQAMKWFETSIRLNRFDGYSFLRYGMCLDWLGRHAEAGPYFERANELDPNGYFCMAHIGWHYVQLEDYAAAKPWFERSLRLQWNDNPIAVSYLEIANRKLLEAATNRISAQLVFP